MIAAVRGILTGKHGERVTVTTSGGVSYEIAVPIAVLERMPADGATVELRTVLVVREDAWSLYGFDTEYDKAVFQRLLSATGVGPKLALALVSTLGGARVVRSLKEGDLGTLCTVPGVGKKTAERMVVELKDKVGALGIPGTAQPGPGPVAEQAVQALTNLGFASADADRAVRAAVAGNGTGNVAELIRTALQILTKAR
ncbi:MAG: Holliday junction branch migration protein RuvA [Gemmatimonadetes bacterium]|nr:Holliday junction branch migration protein RuvA [Gemmatimonadota bacterium]